MPEIQKAFSIANQANLNREELDDLEKREFYIHDQRNAVKKAVKQAVTQAVSEAVNETKIEIAKQLLDVLDEATISQKTGLSIEEIKKLRSGN